MEDEILSIIQEVKSKKIVEGKAPTHALFIQDIMPAVRRRTMETLNMMVSNKKISWANTINDDAFIVLEEIGG